MSFLKHALRILAVGLLAGQSFAANGIMPYSSEVVTLLGSGIDRVLLPVGGDHEWAVFVKDLTTNQVIYAHQPNAWMTPASTQKLVTAVVATKELGASHRFSTTLWAKGEIENHTLKGSVTLSFSGDPTLTHDDMFALLKRLKKAGIRHITGSVFLDTHARSGVPYAPGWMWDDLSFRHGAPVGAIVVDENSFPLEVNWSKKKKRAVLKSNMPDGSVTFSNRIKPYKKSKEHCPLLVYSYMNNHYILSGCMPAHRDDRELHLAIRSPSRYVRMLVQKDLDKVGITLNGHVSLRRRPRGSYLIASHESRPLSELIKVMLKKSNNTIANALFETAGGHHYREAGNWQNGADTVKYHLRTLLHDSVTHWRLVDGSGASRYNALSPRVLVELLSAVYRDPSLYKVIEPALPISGEDGTLEWRMHMRGVRALVHAKTGTMTGVSALSGFINRRDGHVLAFAVMANGLLSKSRTAHAWEDQLCQVLTQDLSISTLS